MVKRIGGSRRKTRHKLHIPKRQRSKLSIRRILASFKEGDRVSLTAYPSAAKGMYHRRFHGLSGIVTGRKGACYEVSIRDRQKEKRIIVHPVHLRRMT